MPKAVSGSADPFSGVAAAQTCSGVYLHLATLSGVSLPARACAPALRSSLEKHDGRNGLGVSGRAKRDCDLFRRVVPTEIRATSYSLIVQLFGQIA